MDNIPNESVQAGKADKAGKAEQENIFKNMTKEEIIATVDAFVGLLEMREEDVRQAFEDKMERERQRSEQQRNLERDMRKIMGDDF